MNFYEFYHFFHKTLKKNYPLKEERENIFFLLACEILNYKKITIRMQLLHKKILDKNIYKIFKKKLKKLKNNEPIQYILGKTNFCELDWIVNKNVFIPRPETEELISWVIKDYSSKTISYILDIGTGSGCISIALKKKISNASIYAIDISNEALKIAHKNAIKHNVNITFYQLDILKNDPPKFWPHFDVIISNPPYIRKSEKKLMNPNVYLYEPNKALFVSDKNPLIFYKKIAEWNKKIKNKNSVIYFEINEFLSNEIISLMKKIGYLKIEIRKDSYGNLRMLKAYI